MFEELRTRIDRSHQLIADEQQVIQSEHDHINRRQELIKRRQSNLRNIASRCRAPLKVSADMIQRRYAEALSKNAEQMMTVLGKKPPCLVMGWQEDQWRDWQPAGTILGDQICVGSFREENSDSKPTLRFPAYAPFIESKKTVIIRCTDRTADAGLSLLQSLVIRSAVMFPHQATFTLLDPAGHGTAFPMAVELETSNDEDGEIHRLLEKIITRMRQRIRMFGLTNQKPIEVVSEEMRANERFHFIFAADFPKEYDRRSIEALQSIGRTGPIAGIYLFVHPNKQYPLPRDVSMDGFENAFQLSPKRGEFNIGGIDLKYVPDKMPNEEMVSELLKKLRNAKPPEPTISWEKIVNIPRDSWWHADAHEFISTPVGRSVTNEPLEIWFGEKGDRQCVHGILAGMTGSGKSNFYHLLITGLAIRYSPDELQMYLVDGKQGVEFRNYRDLPHVRVISLNSTPELSRSILKELVEQKRARNAIFSELGVEKIETYRTIGQPKGKLPRLLLLVDEYQHLFENDRENLAKIRSGIHDVQGRYSRKYPSPYGDEDARCE